MASHPPSPIPPSSSPAAATSPPAVVPTAALVLAGGPAARMGYPKHLLKLPNGRPLYLFIADLVHKACPHLDRIYISLAEGSYLDEDLRAVLMANPRHRPPMTTVNADATPADAAVIGAAPHQDVSMSDAGAIDDPPELAVIWDKKTPILHPPPTRAQQRKEEKKKAGGSRERAEKKSHKNRSTSSSARRAARHSDTSVTTPTTPAGDDAVSASSLPAAAGDIFEVEPDNDADALGGVGGSGAGASSGGPIRGFLAAHEALPDATWLIIACDYPRLTVSAIRYLIEAYEPPITCYRGPVKNRLEPLVSIWSPEALAQLKINCDPASASAGTIPDTKPVASDPASSMLLDGGGTPSGSATPIPPAAATPPTRGIVGTLKQLKGKTVDVPPGGVDDIWMYNVNTPGNWDTALELHDD